jgi:glycine/D-amino acid oxidase-like deaminating enzyme
MNELLKSFSEDHARAVLDAGNAAIHQIHEIIHKEKIECDFRWAPAYLYEALGASESESRSLKKDAEVSARLGFPARFMDSIPVFAKPGVRFPEQAMFHPLHYCSALLKLLDGDGSYVFENTDVEEIEGDPIRIKTKSGTISCQKVIVATHFWRRLFTVLRDRSIHFALGLLFGVGLRPLDFKRTLESPLIR